MGWLWWWWWWWLVSCDGWLLLLLLLGNEKCVRKSLTRQGKGERKKHKIIDRRVRCIYALLAGIVHKCTILPPLMWVFIYSKCVKWTTFSILQDFIYTDANALKVLNNRVSQQKKKSQTATRFKQQLATRFK